MAASERKLYRLEGAVERKALDEILREAYAAPSMAALAPWAIVLIEPPFPDVLFKDSVESATPLEIPVDNVAADAAAMIAVLSEKNMPGSNEAAWGVISAICSTARRLALETAIFIPGDEVAVLSLLKAPPWYRLSGIVAIGKRAEELGTYHVKPFETVMMAHEKGENRPIKMEG